MVLSLVVLGVGGCLGNGLLYVSSPCPSSLLVLFYFSYLFLPLLPPSSYLFLRLLRS